MQIREMTGERESGGRREGGREGGREGEGEGGREGGEKIISPLQHQNVLLIIATGRADYEQHSKAKQKIIKVNILLSTSSCLAQQYNHKILFKNSRPLI